MERIIRPEETFSRPVLFFYDMTQGVEEGGWWVEEYQSIFQPPAVAEVSVCERPTHTHTHTGGFLMLHYNFLIGFSSLLISWLFKQQTHTQTKARLDNIIISCIIIYHVGWFLGGGRGGGGWFVLWFQWVEIIHVNYLGPSVKLFLFIFGIRMHSTRLRAKDTN